MIGIRECLNYVCSYRELKNIFPIATTLLFVALMKLLLTLTIGQLVAC